MSDNIKQDRREGNYMTMTATKTNEQATLNTPEGTLLRLTRDTAMTAKVGATALVGDGSKVHAHYDFLDVRWLKGHHGDKGISQMDGGYPADYFEIHEFQVGDRVRVVGIGFEDGYEGVIESFAPTNGDDCTVNLDNGHTLSYHFDNIVKIENDEAEILPERFATGDIAVLDAGPGLEVWNGLRFLVKEDAGRGFLLLEDGAIDFRPDTYTGGFYWDTDKLRAFDPARDFKVGDVIEAERYGVDGKPAKGIVTKTDLFIGGDIEIDWIEGKSTLVAYGPLGATRNYLKLIGVSVPRPEVEVEVEPEPEPENKSLAVGDRVKVIDDLGDNSAVLGELGVVTAVEDDLLTVLQDNGETTVQFDFRFERSDEPEQPIKSDFDFEVGQEIGSPDVLDDLPLGTVLINTNDEVSPIVKLHDGRFGRLNRYGLVGDGNYGLLAYNETEHVKDVASGDLRGTLLIAYVPGK